MKVYSLTHDSADNFTRDWKFWLFPTATSSFWLDSGPFEKLTSEWLVEDVGEESLDGSAAVTDRIPIADYPFVQEFGANPIQPL